MEPKYHFKSKFTNKENKMHEDPFQKTMKKSQKIQTQGCHALFTRVKAEKKQKRAAARTEHVK